MASAVLLALSATATYYMRLNHSAGLAVGEHFTTLAQTENFIFPDSEIVLRRSYTGIAAVDTGLSFLVAAFLPGASGLNKAFQLQQAHFLFSFMPVLAILSVEASRERNVRNSIVL